MAESRFPSSKSTAGMAVQGDDAFRRMVESVRDYAIFLLDIQGHVASWNLGAERLNGYRADEIIGRHFSVFYPPAAIEKRWPQYELETAARLGHFEDEGWRVRKDGSGIDGFCFGLVDPVKSSDDPLLVDTFTWKSHR